MKTDRSAERREAFLNSVAEIRPRLHRFCTRMCGSRLDGEDVVQDVLAEAFSKLSSLADISRMEPWLFKIAHNRSIDFIRRRKPANALNENDIEMSNALNPETQLMVADALEFLVGRLPPMERAAVVLKDVLDYPLADISSITGSSLGGVKSALHRGREKLRAGTPPSKHETSDPASRNLILDYIDRFNRRDWDGVLALIRADARIELVDIDEGNAREFMKGRYFGTYDGFPWPWKLALVFADGVETIVLFRDTKDGWKPVGAMKLEITDGTVSDIRDYFHVDYLFDGARIG